MTAVITGGSGFIGSWLIDELLKHNYQVIAIVRNKNSILHEYIDNENFSTVMFEDCEHLIYQNEKKIDVFFHLAWGGVTPEEKNNFPLQVENIILAEKMIRLAKNLNCKRFIAAGTVAEYVFSDKVMDVYEKQTPNDIYGAAKVSCHYFLDILSRQLNQPFIWTVIPSTYGERRRDNNIITYTIRSLLRGDIPKYGSLEQMWDFLYVSDVAKALRLIGEKGRLDRIYGIGSGIHRPLREYICEIRDLIDSNLKLDIGVNTNMSTQTFSSCVNIEQLCNDTGFKPEVTFKEGIKRTIEYLRNELS